MDIERVVAQRLMHATGIKCVPDVPLERACSAIEDEPNVFSAVPDGTYRWDDPDTGTPRYQTNINLTICE